jgi:signal transduction histidine kinase
VSASRADSAVRLPWLAPGEVALAGLARGDAEILERSLRQDPAFALLWLRAGAPDFDDFAGRQSLLRIAIDSLDSTQSPSLDVLIPPVAVVVDCARHSARVAERIAVSRGYPDPRRAAVAALLVPLAWLAVAAVDPTAIEDCLTDSDHADDPDRVETQHWGCSAALLSRRLVRAWRLPVWLGAAVSNLDLPSTWSEEIGGDHELTAIVHDSVRFLERVGDPLRLGRDLPPASKPLPDMDLPASDDAWPARSANPAAYLRALLLLARDQLADDRQAAVAALERENESLRQALRAQQAEFADRLKTEKLSALAEFAAGAGHEINNPLAVISGHAQYLLIKEREPDCEKPLHSIKQQADRIHAILTGLMNFARPAAPQKRRLDIRDAARTVATNLHEFAALQRIRIELITPDDPCPVDADPKQLQSALGSLLRNAIEAAPEDGWARITIERRGHQTQVIVEDSGDGPSTAQRPHLFDPFYSGRIAGRGHGLGLPTAWRLAREHGGDVVFDPRPDSPARFVFTLPNGDIFSIAQERKTA